MNRKEEAELLKTVTIMKIQLADVHKEFFGNGKEGMLFEWQQHKGVISAFKWIGGGGGLAGIVSLIIMLINTFGG